MESNYSLADIGAVTGRDNDNTFGGNWAWVVIFLIFAFMGGFGNWGNNAANGALTRADLCQDTNFAQLENGVRGIQQGLCDGFYAMNTGLLNGFNGVQRDLCTGFAGINANINESRFAQQQCCCETNRNVDSVRYENAKNTCDIITANNANTQRIIDHMTQNEMQTLRDQLQTANFQLSQQAQNATLISTLQPTPRPAYITCSPYQSQFYAMNGFGGCNSCC